MTENPYIRALELTQILGQPCECQVPHAGFRLTAGARTPMAILSVRRWKSTGETFARSVRGHAGHVRLVDGGQDLLVDTLEVDLLLLIRERVERRFVQLGPAVLTD